MGGLLFKKGRIPAKDYYILVDKLKEEYLNPKFGKHYNIPAVIKDKKDFGDVDINLSGEIIKPDWKTFREGMLEDLGLEKPNYKFVKSILSTVYDNFQVDYFARKKSNFQSAYNFQSYNSLGNMIGKCVKRLDLKFSENGLFYVYRRDKGKDNHYKSELHISSDMEKICQFLRLDFEHWQNGFTYNEMFNWFSNCKFLITKPFLELNEKNVRLTILKFQNFIIENNLKSTKIMNFGSYDEKIDIVRKLVLETFNVDIQHFIETEIEKERISNLIKPKFNGRIIMNLIPELKGKELGRFMKNFKNSFDEVEDFKAWVVESSMEVIENKIIRSAKEYLL